MEKIYKFAKKNRLNFSYYESFLGEGYTTCCISSKSLIIFTYTEYDNEENKIFIDGKRFNGTVEQGLQEYEDLLLLKGELNVK